MPKVPNKGGFLSLAAAAPQNFPESQTSRVTSPLLVSLLAVQISASGFKGEKLVPPFTSIPAHSLFIWTLQPTSSTSLCSDHAQSHRTNQLLQSSTDQSKPDTAV